MDLATLLYGRANAGGVDEDQRRQLREQSEELCRVLILAEQNWPPDERISEAHAILADTNRFEDADKAYDQAMKIQTTNAVVLLEWGRMLLRRHQSQVSASSLFCGPVADVPSGICAAAAEQYQQIAAIDKQTTEVGYLWDLARTNQKKYADAVTRLREVLASDPQHAKARKLLRVCEEG